MNSIAKMLALIKHDFMQAKTIKVFQYLHERLLVYLGNDLLRGCYDTC